MDILVLYGRARRFTYLIQRQGILFKKVKEEKSRRHFIENTRLFPESLFSPAAVDFFLIKRSKKGEKVQMLQSITSQKTW